MPDEEIPTPENGTEQEPVTPQADPVETPDVESQIEEPAAPTGEPAAPEAPAEVPPAPPTVEERYRQSSSEAIILNGQNKAKDDLINKLTSEDTPTESEIVAYYPEYAQMDPLSKRFALNQVSTIKRQNRIDRQLAEQEADRKWQVDLRTLTKDPKYASLKGNQAFESFVFDNPKYRGVDLQVLADAYMVRTGQTPAAAPADPPPPNAGGLPRGSGGPRGPQKTQKVSLEQASVLRQTNWKEYMRLTKAGLIDDEIEVR